MGQAKKTFPMSGDKLKVVRPNDFLQDRTATFYSIFS